MRITIRGKARACGRRTTLAFTLLMLFMAGPLAQESTVPLEFPVEPEEVDGVPITLKEALATAMDNNLSIAVRRYDPRIADHSILFQRGAFDPSLTLFSQHLSRTDPSRQSFIAGATVLALDQRDAQVAYDDPFSIGGNLNVTVAARRTGTNSTQSSFNPAFSTSLTFTYDQSLLRNFGFDVNTASIRIARRNADLSRSQFRQTVLDTIQSVEKAYWDLKFALKDLAVKRQSMKLSEETLAQNRIRVQVGTMAPIDVTTAEAEVASRQEAVLLAENTLDNARDALLLLLNLPRTSPVWVLPVNPVDDLPFQANLTIDVEAAIQEAFENRPDLEQTGYEIDNDVDRVKQMRSGLRWDLVGRAQYGRVGLTGKQFDISQFPAPLSGQTDLFDGLGDLLDESFDNWLVSLNLVIPLGNKQAKANYLNARLTQEQRAEQLDSQRLGAVIEVRNAARAVRNTIERVKAARANVRLQKARLNAENKRYENGMTTTFDLFQFQDDLTQAESTVLLALVDYNKALADLEAAKGTLVQSRGVEVTDLLAQGAEEPELP
ncbi:MAG: TolC family protein [Acidobacteriota bacterium]